jgi:DNA polymerase-1
MKKYKLSFFSSKTKTKPEVAELDINSIRSKLKDYVNSNVNIKKGDLPLLFGGLYVGGVKAENLVYRSLFIYDLDSYGEDFNVMVKDIEDSLSGYQYIYYTTYSHTFLRPKVRIILFPNSLIDPESYDSLSRLVVTELFSNKLMKGVDESCYEATRRMYAPCMVIKEGVDRFSSKYIDGKQVDLSKYGYEYKTDKSMEVQEIKQKEEISDIELAYNHLPLPDVNTDRVKDILNRYDPDGIEYDDWRDVVFAVHHQYQGSKEGYNILCEWSLRDTTRTRENTLNGCEKHYKRAKISNKKHPLTFATIIKRVNELEEDNDDEDDVINNIETRLIFPVRTKKGKPTNDCENYDALFDYYGIKCSFDIILKRLVITINHSEYGKEFKGNKTKKHNDNPDELESKIIWIEHRCTRHKLSIEDKYLKRYIQYVANENCVNPVKDFLMGIKWDGKDRKKEFYSRLQVLPANEQMRELSLSKFIKQFLCITCFNDKDIDLPARQILVLQGKEHIGKTTFLRNLLPVELKEYFKTTKKVDLDKPMHLKNIVEASIVEFGELKGTLMASGFDAFKGFISDSEDFIDIKYKKNHQKYRRRTSYAASLNDLEFLKAEDENTRFLIVPVLSISREKFDIKQFYAQILEELKPEVSQCEIDDIPLTHLYEMNREELDIQIKFNLKFKYANEIDDYMGLIYTYLDVDFPTNKISRGMSSGQILLKMSELDGSVVINDATKRKMGKALRRAGFTNNSNYEYKVKFKHLNTNVKPEDIFPESEQVQTIVEDECFENVEEIQKKTLIPSKSETSSIATLDVKYEVIDRNLRLLHLENLSLSDITYGLDIETTGLRASTSEIALLQIYHPKLDKVFIYRIIDNPLTDKEKGLLSEINFVAHNASFERSFMPYLKNLNCSMIAYHAATSNRRCSIGDLSSDTGIVYDNKKAMQVSDWAGELTEEQLEYAAKDAKATFILWKKYKDENKPVYERMLKASLIIDDYARRGLPVDVEALTKLRIETENKRDELLQKLTDLGFNDVITPNRNIRTKKEVMDRVTPDVMKIVEEVRKTNSLINNIIKGVESNMVDGRLPINVLICGTETGRLSTINPNVQNFPRSGFRHIFKARDGYRFVRADFSGQELRMVAAMSNEKVLIEAFNAGKDPHAIMAARLNNMPLKTFLEQPKDWQKSERQKAKAANFGFLYGMGPARFIETAKRDYGVDLTFDEATSIKNKFWTAYSFLKKWSDKERAECNNRGYALTRGGRKRHFEDMSSAYCEMINTAVQGSCGEVLLETLIALPDYLKNYLVNTVHDELIFEVPIELVEDEARYTELKNHITGAMITGVSKVERRYPTLNITEIKDTDRL